MKESEIDHVADSQAFNNRVNDYNRLFEINHSFETYHFIAEHFGDDVYPYGDLCKTGKKACIIVGAGPSLDGSYELLRQWEGDILCVASASPTLVYHGIQPTYVVEMDCIAKHEEAPWENTNTGLILHPGCQLERFQKWPGMKYVYLLRDPNDYYKTKVTPIAYPFIHRGFLSFATSGAMALSIAFDLGYKHIYTLGLDFGGSTAGKKRFDRMVFENGEWKQKEWAPSDIKELDVEAKNGKPTNKQLLFHKVGFFSLLALMLVAKREQVKVATCSQEGTVTELPYIPLKQVVKSQGRVKKFWPLRRYEEQTEGFLAEHGKFIFRFHDGYQYGSLIVTTRDVARAVDKINSDLAEQKKAYEDNPEKTPEGVDPSKVQLIDKDKYLKWLEHVKKVYSR